MINWFLIGAIIASIVVILPSYFSLANIDWLVARRAARRGRQHGPWCVVRDRSPLGLQVFFQSRSKGAAAQWRGEHRGEYEEALYLLTSDEVARVNAAAMSLDAYWDLIDEFVPRCLGDVMEDKS